MKAEILIGVLVTLSSTALLGCFAFMLKIIIMVHNHDRIIPEHSNEINGLKKVVDVHGERLDKNDIRYENHDVRLVVVEGEHGKRTN